MTQPVIMAELWRGEILESVHRGHAVVVGPDGDILASWGDPDRIVYPRSSSKMLQALPLVESGAADAAGLGPEQLALACASHQGAPMHADRVVAWLAGIDRSEADLLCGVQPPSDPADRAAMRQAGGTACQVHNNCSGKHAGFVTLARHMGAGPDYIDPNHPVQIAARDAFEEMTDEVSAGIGIDGCSAPNFATSMTGMARAMARMARPTPGKRGTAAEALIAAMLAHPLLVAGRGRACTELMSAMDNVVVKTGAEGFFAGIAAGSGLGIALKIEDGATRASEAAMAAILVRLGLLDAADPMAVKRMNAPVLNRRGIDAAYLRATGFAAL